LFSSEMHRPTLLLCLSLTLLSATAIPSLRLMGTHSSALCNTCMQFVTEVKTIADQNYDDDKQALQSACSRFFSFLPLLEYQCDVIVVWDISALLHAIDRHADDPQATCFDFFHLCEKPV
ncbi:hypothetical protein PMAYCL1PPCAC_24431, partial [Pristionchus mayeri]